MYLTMNKDVIKGNWNIVKGKLKKRWARITDDDLLAVEGSHDELRGILQSKYGYSKNEADLEIRKFIDQNVLIV